MVEIKRNNSELGDKVRELKTRAVMFMEEIIEIGGYFKAVESGFFVDSGNYPERNSDGIVRKSDAGVGAGTVYERDVDYMAPVTAHFGYNNVAQYGEEYVNDPAKLIGGGTFEDPSKIIFIDELDPTDNVNVRLEETRELRESTKIKPEVQWFGDGIVLITMFLPTDVRTAEFAAIEIGKKMGLVEVEAIHKEVMQEAEGTRVELKGKVDFSIDLATLVIPPKPEVLTEDEIRTDVKNKPLKIVAATVGEDEHSVGLREIIDIKHGGIEKYGVECHILGTSISIEKLVDAAIELNADAILTSTIISHDDIHYKMMKKLNELSIEKGIRDKVILIAGGTQVSNELAVENGMDAGFGRGTKGEHVATFLVKKRRELNEEN